MPLQIYADRNQGQLSPAAHARLWSPEFQATAAQTELRMALLEIYQAMLN